MRDGVVRVHDREVELARHLHDRLAIDRTYCGSRKSG